jgi:hypothetical protein
MASSKADLKIRLQDFRSMGCRKGRIYLTGPQAQTETGSGSTCPATALVGGCTGCGNRHQPCESASRVKTRRSLQAAVHHNPNALNGQTGFGNGCGQHNLSHSFGGGKMAWSCSMRLKLPNSGAMRHFDLRPGAFETSLNLSDFTRSRQKHQDAPQILTNCGKHRPKKIILGPDRRVQSPHTGFLPETTGLDM